MKKKLRVLALLHEELVPPEDTSGHDLRNAEWKMEFDVIESLECMGHEVRPLGLNTNLSILQEAIREFRPHVLFNLLEDFHNIATFDQHWVSHLELLRIPYTGCNPKGLMLARDKALSKKILAYHGVNIPDFAVFRTEDRLRKPERLKFPLFVKSLTHDGSMGISQASVVGNERQMAPRVRFIHRSISSPAIVEEFIDGRELYVGILGNERLWTFPVWELHFDRKPTTTRLIATDRAKWSNKYQDKVKVRTREARLSERELRRVQKLAKLVYRLLGMSGYARIDFRLDHDRKVVFLEANPNPQLSYGEDFAESAEKGGLSYEGLLRRILNLALQRKHGV